MPKDDLASYNVKIVRIPLSDNLIKKLNSLASKYRVTLNTVFQTAWALNLSQEAKTNDITMGVTVSQRPADLESSEDIIGLFFNDIPIRVNIEKNMNFWEIARLIQDDFQRGIKYQFLSSYEIKKELKLKHDEDLFQTLLVYENYPKLQEESLKSKQQDHFVNTDYWRREMSDIDLTVYMETQLGAGHIKLCYLENIISDESANSALEGLLSELKRIERND
jgi:non-ribosomal peptide synthetase component F